MSCIGIILIIGVPFVAVMMAQFSPNSSASLPLFIAAGFWVVIGFILLRESALKPIREKERMEKSVEEREKKIQKIIDDWINTPPTE